MKRALYLWSLTALLCIPSTAAAFLNGDIQGDAKLDVSDVQCLVLATLDLEPENPETTPECLSSRELADLDCVDDLNVVDIQLVVQMVLGAIVGEHGMPDSKDSDKDNVHNNCDTCPDKANPLQIDSDKDGLGDLCDETPNGGGEENPCDTKLCDEFATCSLDIEGSAKCSCIEGYEGNGIYCKILGDPCADYVEPACKANGCPAGQVCDTEAECVPSMCICDEKSGVPICSDDCDGGVCIDNAECEAKNCAMFCEDGYKVDESGCPTCECKIAEDLCADFDPEPSCDAKEGNSEECEAQQCECNPADGTIKCTDDDCGIGSCANGAYCEGPDCAGAVCYMPNHPMSLLMCGGVLDPSCGDGTCVGEGYCTGDQCDDSICYDTTHPISELLCGKVQTPGVGCGVGACDDNGHYCDDCVCYTDDHPLSLTFCGCGKPTTPNTFQKVYGHYEGGDIAMAGVELADGGFFFGGWSGRAFRTDSFGNLIWKKWYKYSWFNDVAAYGNDLYLLEDDGVIAADLNGDIQWTRKSGGFAHSVAVAADGGVVWGGEMGEKFFIFKTDTSGNFQWGHKYGGSNRDVLTHIEALDDGYLLQGWTKSFGAQDADILLIRTNLDGIIQWAKRMGGSDNDGDYVFYHRATATSDGGFMIAGFTESFGAGSMDGLAIKLTSSGNISWAKAVGGVGLDFIEAAAQVPGGYAFFGTTRNIMVPGENAVPNIWMSKLDNSGDLVWSRVYGDIYMDGNYVDGGATSDGGLFLIAHSHNYFVDGPTHKAHYLVKTDSEGLTEGCCNSVNFNPQVASVTLDTADVTSQIFPQSLADNLDVLSITAAEYEQAGEYVICETLPDGLCGTISTGSFDCE